MGSVARNSQVVKYNCRISPLTLTHVTPKSFGFVMFIVCLLARYICQSQLFRFLEDTLGLIHAT